MVRKRRRRRRRTGSSGIWKFGVGIVVGILVIVLIGGPGSGLPEILPSQDRPAEPVVNDTPAETLYLADTDRTYLNRIFRERTHEIAYCGLAFTANGKEWIEPWLADTVTAGRETVHFSTANCPDTAGMLKSTIHTHPSGNPQLSELDRSTLAVSKQRVMCIQVGAIDADLGTTTENLVCYEDEHFNGRSQISTVPVVVDDRIGGHDQWEWE